MGKKRPFGGKRPFCPPLSLQQHHQHQERNSPSDTLLKRRQRWWDKKHGYLKPSGQSKLKPVKAKMTLVVVKPTTLLFRKEGLNFEPFGIQLEDALGLAEFSSHDKEPSGFFLDPAMLFLPNTIPTTIIVRTTSSFCRVVGIIYLSARTSFDRTFGERSRAA